MEPFTVPDRPPALPVTKTCTYKKTGGTLIPIDVYLPVALDATCPVMLFIHGGGWSSGSRSDYCRPLFKHFLSLGFIVTSMDYRLLPETSLAGQLEDVRDVESWLRYSLPVIFTGPGLVVDGDKIIVVGASAGAHLALLTPKLWRKQPTAILSMYGPTNMHNVPSLGTGRFSNPPPLQLPTPELLVAATTFEAPPTEITPPKNAEDYMRPRALMGRKVFTESLIVEFLIKGLPRDESGEPKLPEKGSVSKEEINAISPLQLSQDIHYPPVYQVIAEDDDIFDSSHGHSFHEALKQLGVECKKIVVPGRGHAFDIWEAVGGEIDKKVIDPAVKWVTSR
ncbi:Alpha/Beta hydrolase protein [Tricladium varicosporioides]|nr:Alpha/Beta hydrolase protein [Hymenoscyphus varicosporioides]